MPGGKVVFYTGILPICETNEGIAVVMGHEIAHAIARHGNERMSQQLAIQAGGVALTVLLDEKPAYAQNLFLASYGVGSQIGQLAFSRQHESEADKMGLIFMAMAGYDPREAVDFWQRMSEQSGGQQPPEFLSTHPSHETRISDLENFLPEALEYYNP
jgi:predicted Zn-dependent protease